MYDVVAIGEILIDFTPCGVNEINVPLFACNPGGAPANLLAMNTKLGGSAAFIGKVGNDQFGRYLQQTLENAGIDISGLQKSSKKNTTLAFVQLDEKGDRTFSFYRDPGADVMISPDEVPGELLHSCRIFHFGSVSMTCEPCRSATLYAAREAKKAGAVISYDPNYRPALWANTAEAVRIMQDALTLADIIKVSDEEMTLLTGTPDMAAGADLLAQNGATLVLVTGGEKGAYYRTACCRGVVPAYQVDAVDTTGSGDAFLGALLYQLRGMTKEQIAALPEAELEKKVETASAAGGLTATQKGAIPAMPSRDKLEAFMKTAPKNTEACMKL